MTTEKKIQTRLLRFTKCSDGIAAVEFALVLPVIVLIIFGTIEFGRMMMVQQILTNAARAGAREAALSDSTQASVNAIITTALGPGGFTVAPTVTLNPANPVNPPPPAGQGGFGVSVTITVPFSTVSWLSSTSIFPFLSTVQLTGQCTMRKEK